MNNGRKILLSKGYLGLFDEEQKVVVITLIDACIFAWFAHNFW